MHTPTISISSAACSHAATTARLPVSVADDAQINLDALRSLAATLENLILTPEARIRIKLYCHSYGYPTDDVLAILDRLTPHSLRIDS